MAVPRPLVSPTAALSHAPLLLLAPLPQTGMLWNTEGGSPMVPIGEEDLPAPILVRQCSGWLVCWAAEHCGRRATLPPRLGSACSTALQLPTTQHTSAVYLTGWLPHAFLGGAVLLCGAPPPPPTCRPHALAPLTCCLGPTFPRVQGSTAPAHVRHEPGQRARVFQGGYYLDLHKMLDVRSGSQVSVRLGLLAAL